MEIVVTGNSTMIKECHQELSDRSEDIKALQDNVQNNQQLLFMGQSKKFYCVMNKWSTVKSMNAYCIFDYFRRIGVKENIS